MSMERIRRAEPSGIFHPASHASTVLVDTPINPANKTCVISSSFRIFLISVALKSGTGDMDQGIVNVFSKNRKSS